MQDQEINLIEKAKSGDEEAFNRIFIQHQKLLFNFIYQLTGDRDEADDITQEALIIAYRKLNTFRYESSFRTWLTKIAINLFRKKRERKQKHVSLCLEKIKMPSSEENPERIVIRRELQWCIIHNLRHHVPKKYRTVLILRDAHNFSYKEISEILGWSVSKTKTRLHRARKLFREQFINGKCKAFTDDYLCICEGILDI